MHREYRSRGPRGRLMVSRAGQVFDEAGAMVDEKTKALLQQFLQGFVASLAARA